MVATLHTDNVIDKQISIAIGSVIVNTAGKSKLRVPQLSVAFSALICSMAVSSGVHAADDGGWYTQEQATRGHQLFNNFCAQCHRPDLTGAAGPALVGDAFLKKWSSKPLGDLFTFEHTNMPATNPGSLPDDTMWSITAYILQKNGFAAGPAALGQQTGANRTLAGK